MTIDFLKPARMDDVLTVTSYPEVVKGASLTMCQKVARGDDLLLEAHVRVAFVCGGRARPIPKPLRIARRPGAERRPDLTVRFVSRCLTISPASSGLMWSRSHRIDIGHERVREAPAAAHARREGPAFVPENWTAISRQGRKIAPSI
jgi:Thioesterase superfamily